MVLRSAALMAVRIRERMSWVPPTQRTLSAGVSFWAERGKAHSLQLIVVRVNLRAEEVVLQELKSVDCPNH